MGSVETSQYDVDAIVIGGGFGGCYSLYKLRKLGFSTHLFEAGSALGGVWHWNSYPGARVDSEMPYYQFSIPEVWKTWSWSQRFPDHAELKAYFAHVDKVLDLSKDISYKTIVTGADFNADTARWTVTTNAGITATCKWLIPATGSSYKRYEPDFAGMSSFKGQIIHSAVWPASPVDFQGKRVAVVGAGATGVQCVQEISKAAAELTVYIRNINIALPMGQRDVSELESRAQKAIYKSLFGIAQKTAAGLACDAQPLASSEVSAAERQQYWEELWDRGGFSFQAANYRDFLVNQQVNREIYDFWKERVRSRVRDPAKQAIVAPDEPPFPFATKRSSLEQDYYESLDKDNVHVVSVKKTPIKEFTENGITTDDGTTRAHDIVVLATGYDNMTGSLTSMGLRGKDNVDLKERWKEGVWTQMGIFVSGCPNMFMIYGPQAPTAFTNAPVFIEMQVDLVTDFLVKLRDDKVKTIEARHSSEEQWKNLIQDMNDQTLFPLCDSSWYTGANIPGKKREQLNYIGGMDNYIKTCLEELKDLTTFDVAWEDGKKGPVAPEQIPALR